MEQLADAREVLLEALNLRMGDSSEEGEATRQGLRVQISDLEKLIDGNDQGLPALTPNQKTRELGLGGRVSDLCGIGDRFGFNLADQRGRPLATFSYPTNLTPPTPYIR